MAADSAVNKAAGAATGAVKSVAKAAWNRVTPFSLSGLYTTVGVGALFVGGAWLLAPAAMAAAPAIVPATTATASTGTTVATMAANATSQFFTAVGASAKGIGHIVTTANTETMGAGVKTFFNGLNGGTVAASSSTITATTTGTSALPAAAGALPSATGAPLVQNLAPL